jgi:tetratricopeptide (TPR) repeat protein
MQEVNITLAVICCERDKALLARMIESVRPLVSHISAVVTDYGDGCKTVIEQSGIPSTVDQMLFAKRTDFDFSAARNRSFENAPTDIVLWLDCDDIVSAPEGLAEGLKAMQDNSEIDAIIMPYDCGVTAGNIKKLRIVRKDRFRWINKVHEELATVSGNPPKVYQTATIVTHAPGDKSNHDFHLSLLMEGCRNAPNEYAYIGRELFNCGRLEEALPWLEKTAAINASEIEQYSALTSAGICYEAAKDDGKALDAWHRATRILPHRREAWFHLSRVHGRNGRTKKCLAYAAACNAQIDFREPLQNVQIYHTDGYKLHAKALLAMGIKDKALVVINTAKTDDEECEQIRQEAQ